MSVIDKEEVKKKKKKWYLGPTQAYIGSPFLENNASVVNEQRQVVWVSICLALVSLASSCVILVAVHHG